jgi:hypothetical protein
MRINASFFARVQPFQMLLQPAFEVSCLADVEGAVSAAKDVDNVVSTQVYRFPRCSTVFMEALWMRRELDLAVPAAVGRKESSRCLHGSASRSSTPNANVPGFGAS